MMDSGGGGHGNASNGGGDDDQNALLELGGHHRHPFEQSRGNSNHQNHLPISTNIIIRKTIPYFIALALACFVLYQSSDHVQYYLPISYDQLSRQSQNSTPQSCQSSSTSDQGKFSGPTNLSPVLNNSSATPAPEKSPTNVSSSTHPQENVPSSPAVS